MNLAETATIASELHKALGGRRFLGALRLSRFELALDFGISDSRYLYVCLEPADPRCYLIRRKTREIEKASLPPTPFLSLLRKMLRGAAVESARQTHGERVIEISLWLSQSEGAGEKFYLEIQLTGRSANLFLLDAGRAVIDSVGVGSAAGQSAGDIYSVPKRSAAQSILAGGSTSTPEGTSLSEFFDRHYSALAEERQFTALANAARKALEQKISKSRRLAAKLRDDLASHGDAENWKRIGDMLLANASTARREGGVLKITDFYDPNLAEIEIEADRGETPSQAAERFFKKYSKARNAQREIASRLTIVEAELQKLDSQRIRLEAAFAANDPNAVSEFVPGKGTVKTKRTQKSGEASGFARKFVSVDGFEILVGKKAKDNDYLTFREARSNDLWLHAADYPGSHVIVRNPNKKDIPHRTLLEAAELAAFYSQGKKQPKAAVHYTQKKFVNKPRGAAPGLVRLASFKTILVEPKAPNFTS